MVCARLACCLSCQSGGSSERPQRHSSVVTDLAALVCLSKGDVTALQEQERMEKERRRLEDKKVKDQEKVSCLLHLLAGHGSIA